jgi:hypothetical protein
MPEKTELQAQHETAEHYRKDMLEDDCEVLAVWADCTEKEDGVEDPVIRPLPGYHKNSTFQYKTLNCKPNYF